MMMGGPPGGLRNMLANTQGGSMFGGAPGGAGVRGMDSGFAHATSPQGGGNMNMPMPHPMQGGNMNMMGVGAQMPRPMPQQGMPNPMMGQQGMAANPGMPGPIPQQQRPSFGAPQMPMSPGGAMQPGMDPRQSMLAQLNAYRPQGMQGMMPGGALNGPPVGPQPPPTPNLNPQQGQMMARMPGAMQQAAMWQQGRNPYGWTD